RVAPCANNIHGHLLSSFQSMLIAGGETSLRSLKKTERDRQPTLSPFYVSEHHADLLGRPRIQVAVTPARDRGMARGADSQQSLHRKVHRRSPDSPARSPVGQPSDQRDIEGQSVHEQYSRAFSVLLFNQY